MIFSRYVGTVTGRYIRHILDENILKIRTSDLKNKFRFCKIDNDNFWKVKFIKELTDLKQGSVSIEAEAEARLSLAKMRTLD